MYWRRVRTRLRFARSRGEATRKDAALLLNCPLCGQHLAQRGARDTCVYACSEHGAWFAAAEDGRLYDVQKLKCWRGFPPFGDRSPGWWDNPNRTACERRTASSMSNSGADARGWPMRNAC